MVRRIDRTSHCKTFGSNSFRFRTNRTADPRKIRLMIYSLTILNDVSPTPSTKQSGKMFQRKMDRSSNAPNTKYPIKTEPDFILRRRNQGAMNREILCVYRVAIHNWVGKLESVPWKTP